MLPLDFKEFNLLQKEADFYQIEPFIQCLNNLKPLCQAYSVQEIAELSNTRTRYSWEYQEYLGWCLNLLISDFHTRSVFGLWTWCLNAHRELDWVITSLQLLLSVLALHRAVCWVLYFISSIPMIAPPLIPAILHSILQQFTDDTTVVGLISKGGEFAYRD